MSVKAFLREKGMQVGTAVMVAAPAIMCAAGAANDTVALSEADGSTSVVSIISNAVTGLKTDAMSVIGAAIGLGVVFWGAKVLWGKFKGMAK